MPKMRSGSSQVTCNWGARFGAPASPRAGIGKTSGVAKVPTIKTPAAGLGSQAARTKSFTAGRMPSVRSPGGAMRLGGSRAQAASTKALSLSRKAHMTGNPMDHVAAARAHTAAGGLHGAIGGGGGMANFHGSQAGIHAGIAKMHGGAPANAAMAIGKKKKAV